MLNKTTTDELAMFLPLVKKELNKEVYEYFQYKWGLVDGMWHSHKNALKNTGIQLKDSPEKLEHDIEKLILARHNKMFTCQNCKNDYRKVGLKQTITGKKIATAFISQKGSITRLAQDNFYPTKYKNVQEIQYDCQSCGRQLDDTDEMMFIMENGLTRKSIGKFMEQFCGAKIQVNVRRGIVVDDYAALAGYVNANARWADGVVAQTQQWVDERINIEELIEHD